MIDNKKILAVIPARLGSKGLKKKNIKLINNQPLINYSIKSCLKSKLIDKIFVSTESSLIKKISEKQKINIDFLRPKNLSLNNSKTSDVVKHVILKLKKDNQFFDYVALIEPTSPIRKKNDIDNGIKILHKNSKNFDALISLGEVSEIPNILKKLNNHFKISPAFPKLKKIYRRQDAEKYYFPYGVIYIAKVKNFLKEKTFYCKNSIGMLIDKFQCYEIDNMNDFICVEAILKKFKAKL